MVKMEWKNRARVAELELLKSRLPLPLLFLQRADRRLINSSEDGGAVAADQAFARRYFYQNAALVWQIRTRTGQNHMLFRETRLSSNGMAGRPMRLARNGARLTEKKRTGRPKPMTKTDLSSADLFINASVA